MGARPAGVTMFQLRSPRAPYDLASTRVVTRGSQEKRTSIGELGV